MNRETILESVHRHLHESLVDTGDVRPIGEIVADVAIEIRAGSAASVAATVQGVIPIEKVAAFVDGQVEPAEADLICEAVMVDNSIIAEIVAAIRAKQVSVEKLPPLPASLSARLLAMNSNTSIVRDVDDDREQSFQVSELKVQHKANLPARMHGVRRRKPVQIAVALVAIAATIVIGFVMLGRQDDEALDQRVVVDDDGLTPQLPSLPNEAPSVLPPPNNQPPMEPIQSIVGNDPLVPRLEGNSPEPNVSESDLAIAKVTKKVEADGKGSSTEEMPPKELNPLVDPGPAKEIAAVRGMTDVRWTEVSGLLAQRNELPAQSGSGPAVSWRRVSEGAPTSANESPADKVTLRTLPFSRASGKFASGGRIVIAGDTGLQIARGGNDAAADLDLMYGSVAMVNLPRGTAIRLQHGDQTFATLRWRRNASVVVHRQSTGIQIQIDGGQVEINDQTVNKGSLRIANDRTIQSVPSPKRLPRWIARPDESTAADRMILAQIADTTDLTATLNQKINALASSQRLSGNEKLALAKLANWQAAMTGANLYRLVGSRVPAVRLAALQRLARLTESDPRYTRTWNATERALNNAQRSAQIRGWYRMLRNGTRPNATQLEQMLSGLSARDFAGRALSDFMLRQFVRNPPPFDPSWTGQRLQRAVTVYRERAGVANDRLRPNAAAANGR